MRIPEEIFEGYDSNIPTPDNEEPEENDNKYEEESNLHLSYPETADPFTRDFDIPAHSEDDGTEGIEENNSTQDTVEETGPGPIEGLK